MPSKHCSLVCGILCKMNLSIPLESFPMNREPSFSFRECKHVVCMPAMHYDFVKRGMPFRSLD